MAATKMTTDELTSNPGEVAHTPPCRPIMAAFDTFPLPTRFVSTYAEARNTDLGQLTHLLAGKTSSMDVPCQDMIYEILCRDM